MNAIAVTGVGARTALGDEVATTWSALLRGECGVRRVPELAAAGLAVTMGASAQPRRQDDPAAFESEIAGAAIDEALGQAGRDAREAAFVWACGLDAISVSPTFARTGSGEVFDRLAGRFAAPRLRVATACSASAQAVVEAIAILRAGRAAACVVGGSSAMLTPFYVHGLGQLGVLAADRLDGAVCRPFDRGRDGTTLGDGAAAVVLETLVAARARGARPLAVVLGAGTSLDAHDYFKPPPDGAGAALAIRRALAAAGLAATDLAGVIAHATGTVGGDVAEAAALDSVAGGLADVPVAAIKGAVGHTMMAAGAVGVVAGVLAVLEARLPPTANLIRPDPECRLDHVLGRSRSMRSGPVLVNAFGMGGHNVAIVVGPAEGRHGRP